MTKNNNLNKEVEKYAAEFSKFSADAGRANKNTGLKGRQPLFEERRKYECPGSGIISEEDEFGCFKNDASNSYNYKLYVDPRKDCMVSTVQPAYNKITFSDEVEVFEFEKTETVAVPVPQYFESEKTYKFKWLDRKLRRQELRMLRRQKRKIRKLRRKQVEQALQKCLNVRQFYEENKLDTSEENEDEQLAQNQI